MQVAALSSALQLNTLAQATDTATQNAQTAQTATNAFGLSFDSLLKIILTQLTYQDPLKPMDNFEFVSQLAQFSQIQQSQVMADRLGTLVSAQGTIQATALLGKTVNIATSNATLIGKVTAVSFQNGDPRISVLTADNQKIDNLPLTSVSQIREGN